MGNDPKVSGLVVEREKGKAREKVEALEVRRLISLRNLAFVSFSCESIEDMPSCVIRKDNKGREVGRARSYS